jgi:hypothetical protein
MKMHVDMIRRDKDGSDTKEKWGFVLVVYGWLDAVLVAVGETISRKVVCSWTIRSL